METERLYELSPLDYARHYNDQGLGWGMSDGTTRGAEARALIAKLIDAEIERQSCCEWCKSFVGKMTANDEDSDCYEIKFCPNCGRKLGDE